MSGALAKGTLPAATRERIALAIAQVNECGYCLSAHTFFGRNGAKLDDGEISERMSGNLCRCAAYPNIVDAIRELADAEPEGRTADEKDAAMAEEVVA